jgi:hypothetical protein
MMPSNTQIARYVTLCLSGMVGAIVAILGDITQKDTASAVIKISTTVNSTLQLGLATIVWAAVLVVLGVALSLIFEPTSKKMAFFVGASVIALIMTATPYEPLPSEPGTGSSLEGGGLIVPASYAGPIVAAQAAPGLALTVTVSAPPDGQAGAVTLSILDTDSGDRWQQQLNVNPGDTVSQTWSLPAPDRGREIMVRAESSNYQIENRSDTIQPGTMQHTIDIVLRPSAMPQFLQRLLEPYKF